MAKIMPRFDDGEGVLTPISKSTPQGRNLFGFKINEF